jgi:translocation protein SEC62
MSGNKINSHQNNPNEKFQNEFKELSKLYLDLEKKGLITKHAGLGDQRVSFCRGRDLKKVFEDFKEEISKKIYDITGVDIGPKGSEALQNFYIVFCDRRMLLKADKFDEDLKKAFPKRLKPVSIQEMISFDDKKLYVVNIERPQEKSHLFLLSITIFIVFSICLFPIWPLWLKLFIWWALFIFLVSIVNIFCNLYIVSFN